MQTTQSYLLFPVKPSYPIDEDGTEGTLEEHLAYVDNGGTPDMWDSVETENIMDVVKQVRYSGLHLIIVRNDGDPEVVGEFDPSEYSD